MYQEVRTALPKNIRQIGQIQEDYRIYVEDYVTTYLNQVAGGIRDKAGVVLLLGESYEEDGKTFYFVRGAIASEDEYEIGKDELFPQTCWRYFHERRQDYFSQMQVVGWALIKGELGNLSEEYISERILQDGEWKGLLFLEIDRYNCIDRFYVCGAPLRRACSGYYIFYDKNVEMQNYLITWNEQKGKKPNQAQEEIPVKHFREVMRDKKKEENGMKGSTLVAACAVIALAVFTISSLNRYGKLKGFDDFIGDIGAFVEEKLSGVGQNIEVIDGNEDKPDGQDGGEELSADNGQAASDGTSADNEQAASDGASADNEQAASDGASADSEQATSDGASAGSEQATLNGDGADKEQTGSDGTSTDNEQATSEEVDNPSGSTNDNEIQETTGDAVTPEISYTVYIIQPGDTLFDISRRYYGDVHMVDKICEINQIVNGDSIYFGQKILLP